MDVQPNSAEQWNLLCSDYHLCQVSLLIADWRELAPFLKLTPSDEHNVIGFPSPRPLPAQRVAMLRIWKEKNGEMATYQNLADIFENCCRQDLVDKLGDLLFTPIHVEVSDSPASTYPKRTPFIIAALVGLILALALNIYFYQYEDHSPATSLETMGVELQYVPTDNQTCSQQSFINQSSLPDSLLQYQDFLRDVYHRYNYSKYSKPSEYPAINRPERPINLVLVHKEKNFDSSHDEQIRFAFHGNVDKIQKLKSPMEIVKIGHSLTKAAAHFVLIEGSAGIGKSTLCWQLCKLWLEHKLQHTWDLVVLVEIRDENTRKATKLYDLLQHPDDKIRESIAQEIQKREGKGLMMIFDGYDELSSDQRSEFSIIQKILSNRVLEKATIVVTSRPFATRGLPAQFRQNLDQHIEIAGFNKTDIDTYVRLACRNNTKMLGDLRSYVSNRTFILSVMYNPLHCTIVTELYIQYWLEDRKGFVPSTLTELYTALVLNLLKRRLPWPIINLVELIDLPVYDNLMQLAELAATGLEEKNYVFKSVPNDTLSLMVSVRHLYDERPKKVAYMFLHLTLQEYLSALHWNSLPQKQQQDLIHEELPKYFNPVYLYDSETEDFIMNETVHWPHILFLAGLTKLNNFPLKVMSLATFIGPVCQLVFESQSPQIVSKIFGNERIEVAEQSDTFDTISNFDWFAIGYCVAISNYNKSAWEFHNLNRPQQLELLSNGLHYNSTIVTNWNVSRMTINVTSTNLLNARVYSTKFTSLYPFTKAISHLSLSSGRKAIDSECCFHVLQNLSHYCPYLQSLYIGINFGSFLPKKPVLDVPKQTVVTFKLKLPQHTLLLDKLHQYQLLKSKVKKF